MQKFELALELLDGGPPSTDLASLAAGDLDGDGRVELVTGGGVLGPGALLWYRPGTGEHGLIDAGRFGVGLAVEDLNGNGLLEVVAASLEDGKPLYWYWHTGRLAGWERFLLTDALSGSSHDIIFADLAGNGRRLLVTNDISRSHPAVHILTPGSDHTTPWKAYPLQEGCLEEGLAAGDLDGDGRLEVVSGPNWYAPPEDGPLSGPWRRRAVAPDFREMCRVALLDVTGNGRLDAVLVESEYDDGRLAWFENRLDAGDGPAWRQHLIDTGLAYGHSLDVRPGPAGGIQIFVAEMAHGGYGAAPNYAARLLLYETADGGASFQRRTLYRGAGTHEALRLDLDGDGRLAVVGKRWRHPKVQVWHPQPDEAAPEERLETRHRFLDRDKPGRAVEILAADVDGDGHLDAVCGAWWYAGPDWRRFTIPGINQVVAAYDLDGDGRDELVAVPGEELGNRLCWLKPVAPREGRWEQHPIGAGSGDWPHGAVVAPLLPGGRPALAVAYHSAVRNSAHHPELFVPPADPREGPWERRVLAPIKYSEQLVAHDLTGNGRLDLIAGTVWLENQGNGQFTLHRFAAPDFYAARIAVTDITGNRRPDIVLAEGRVHGVEGGVPVGRLAWCEHPGDPSDDLWPMHVIDTMRAPHSLGAADLDGDGRAELVCAEHDPHRPYRSRCRLFLYRQGADGGRSWYRTTLDGRFEHHCGAQIFARGPGNLGILSHGWRDSRYVHLWSCRHPN